MMKKIAFTLASLTCSTFIFANPIHITDCPSAELVSKHANFNQVLNDQIPKNGLWVMIDNQSYSNQGKEWFTVMSVKLNAKSMEEALIQGTDFYHQHVNLNTPIVMYDAFCVYAQSNDNFGLLAVPNEGNHLNKAKRFW